MIVSMLISGIVIGIAYYGFELFKRQFKRYDERSVLNRDFILLKRALNQDFESSAVLMGSANQLIFYSDVVHVKRAVYVINESFVVRYEPLENDTFNLQCRVHLIKHSLPGLAAIKEITLKIKVDDEYIDCVFNKYYSARDLMDCQKNFHEQSD